MYALHWNLPFDPDSTDSVLDAVFGPTRDAIGIRSDDRLCTRIEAPQDDILVLTLASKPPGERLWATVPRASVELVCDPTGQMGCHKIPAERPEGGHVINDTEAARALGVDRRTWLAVRAIAELGLASASAYTPRQAIEAAVNPHRVESWQVARRLAERAGRPANWLEPRR